MATQQKADPHTITYSVNGQPYRTEHAEMTVRAILTDAGFTPPEQYRLIRDEGNKKLPNLDEQIHLHNNEKFTAIFDGPTPVS